MIHRIHKPREYLPWTAIERPHQGKCLYCKEGIVKMMMPMPNLTIPID